jgi:ankyrin repeat protein
MQPALRTIRRSCMEVLFVNTLNERSNLEHLRKQAKDLLHAYRQRDPAALARLRAALPVARGKSDSELGALGLRLHDMQSCIAREHGAASWTGMKDRVELLRTGVQDLAAARRSWLKLVYGGDVAGGPGNSKPEMAAQLLAQRPELIGEDALLACAIGEEIAIRRAIDADAGWVNRAAGPLNIPPLIAVTHSALAKIPAFREPLLRCAQLLLERGADPDQSIGDRRPPHSLEQPGEGRLTAVYGAAGKVHDEKMLALLLAAGANPDDNESLYHSIDDPRRDLPCMKILLAAGARVAGTNALAKILDYDHLEGLQALLAHTPHGDPDLGRILHWAIYRGRSAAHVRAILAAGADPNALNADRLTAYRHAAAFGLPEVMRLLAAGGSGEPLSDGERFVVACARADATSARRELQAKPDMFASLSEAQLKQLPNLAMAGRDDAVRLMVELGWPIGIRGGDIDGSALNWAVFRGRPELAEFLLAQGASFREPHGYGSDVIGTLAWASVNEPRRDGDWPACAEALVAHGLPPVTRLATTEPSGTLVNLRIDGRDFWFADVVAEVLLQR